MYPFSQTIRSLLKHGSWATLLTLIGAAAAPAAWAVPVTFGFAGTLTDDPYGVLGTDFSFSGSYTFDSAAADLAGDPQTGIYLSSGAGFGFQSVVAGTTYSIFDSLYVNDANNYAGPIDQYGAVASDGALTLELFFQDNDATVFSSDALPLAAPSLTSFELSQFRLFGDGVEFLGRVEQLACTSGCNAGEPSTSVPEPASGGLLLGALGALSLARRRRIR